MTKEAINWAEVDDIELLHRIADQDRDAFIELHKRYIGLVHSTIYKVLNDSQDTEDVAQEVFIQIWKKASLFNEQRGKPLTWAVTMSKNRAIDRLRSKKRRFRLRNEFEEESRTKAPLTAKDSSDLAYAAEKQHIVRSAVMELSDEQREAIEMAYFSGMTQNEIADRLGQPLGTIKARIRRGVLRLRGTVPHRL